MICSVDGCSKKHQALGYCSAHYTRLRRYGDALASAPSKSVADRFWSKCEKTIAAVCWEWQAASNVAGYGQFVFEGRLCMAHRVAYVLSVGPIPEGLQIDHLCRNVRCVNPSHLEPVTPKENVARSTTAAVARARQLAKTHCPHGHAYDEANTYVGKKGERHCRSCGRLRDQARRRAVA